MDTLVDPADLAVPGRPARARAELALEARDLSQAYGPVKALDGVSLDVPEGELLAVVGYSGSGKSTLLRLIAGLEKPRRGTVALDGRIVSSPSVFVPPEERGVGMMFQDYALFPHLTVLKNVMFGLRRMPSAVACRISREALDRVGLLARENDYPHALSGGEQQRVALARALVPRPAVLLMDEPFSNLDRRTRDTIRDDTAAVLREAGTTVVLVTHDHDDAMRLADRVMLMRSGRIVQSGSAEELYRRPGSLAAARFFSDFNEVPAVSRGGGVATPIGVFPAPGIAEGGRVVVCLRPQAIRLADGAGIAGRVIGRQFVGDAQLVQIAVDGLDLPLQAALPLDTLLVPGGAVRVAFDERDALVFADEGG